MDPDTPLINGHQDDLGSISSPSTEIFEVVNDFLQS